MPRKHARVSTQLPPAPKPVRAIQPVQPPRVLTLEGQEVVKVTPGKRAGSPPLLELTPLDPASDASKKPKTVSKNLRIVIPPLTVSRPPPKGPAEHKYCIVKHLANKHYTFLGVEGFSNTRDGILAQRIFFAYFPPDMFFLQKSVASGVADPMPYLEISPAPKNLEIQAAPWWQNPELDRIGGGIKSLPAPKQGFLPGDFVSFKFSPGSYGKVIHVVYRTSSEHLYLVCAVIDGHCRLVMAPRMQVAGPEFTFVPPEVPFWSKRTFPLLHAEHPDRFSFFEAPAGGFDVGDPVTVFPAGSKLPIDAKIVFVTKMPGRVVASYHAQLPGGQIICYPENDVFGPRVERFCEDLDPAHLTPDPDLMQAVLEDEEEEWGILGCDEEMPEKPPPTSSGMARHFAAALDSAVLMPFVTPPRDLTVPNTIRGCTGSMEIPYPGVLINEAARRIRARDDARGGPAP